MLLAISFNPLLSFFRQSLQTPPHLEGTTREHTTAEVPINDGLKSNDYAATLMHTSISLVYHCVETLRLNSACLPITFVTSYSYMVESIMVDVTL